MTDANTSAAKALHEKCAIHHSIQQKDLLNLLGAVVESLRVGDAVTDPETQVPKIYSDWLSLEFVRERSEGGITPNGFYIHPLIKKRSDAENLRLNILTLEDVADLFKSLPDFIDEKIKKNEYSNVDVLNEEQNQLLDRLKADQNGELVKRDLNFLRDDSRVLLSVVATLGANVKEGEKAPEINITLPDQYKSLLNGTLSVPTSWEWVKPLVADVVKAELSTRVIFFDFDGSSIGVDVKEIRFFLNSWLKKLYDEHAENFRVKGTPLPESRLFDATNKLPLYFDLDIWVELDRDIAKFIAGELGDVIEKYLTSKGGGAGLPVFEKKTTEEEETKENVTKNVRKVEDVDDLIKKFEQAGKSYADETNRLTTILLPQFFAMHGIRKDIEYLSSIDGGNFRQVEREFRLELENVLRSLSPTELQLLSTRGASLEFRLIILRKLYGKLSTNPRFIGSLTQYKENYVEEIERRISKGEPLQSELKELNIQANLPDDAFERALESQQRSPRNDWLKDDTLQTKGVGELAEFSNLHELTQRDFQMLVSRLTSSGSIDYDTLIRNLDVIIAERWSPEQLRHLDPGQAQAVFGMILPDSIKGNSEVYRLFLQLCAEYLYARRQRLADHYQLDQISRESSSHGDLASLAEARELADRYKEYGGGEAVIVARASDSTRVSSYSSSIATGVKAIHDETKEARKQGIDARHTDLEKKFSSETTISGKRKLLASLGVLTPDIDNVNNDEAAQFALLRSMYEEAMGNDYYDQVEGLDSMSYYEDEDRAYVQEGSDEADPSGQPQRRPTPQRYGQPGARSLMKGALNLKNKYKTAKDRIKKAKKAAKAAKKALKRVDDTMDKVEKVALAPFLGPLAMNKWVRRGAVGALIGMVLDTINLMQHSLGASIGGFFGGVGVGGITFFAGGGLFAVPAGIVGTWMGARAGAALESSITGVPVAQMGMTPAATLPAVTLPAVSTGLGGTSLAKGGTSSQAALGGTAQPSRVAGARSAVAAGSYIGGTMVIATATIAAGLQAPPIATLNASGLESRYVSIRKTTTSATSFPGAVPGQITYQIFLQAKDNYQIELQNFQDDFTIKVNSELNDGSPAELSCDSQMNMDTAVTKTFSSTDGEVLLGECTVPLDETYHDSSILNEVTVQFKVFENGTEIPNPEPNLGCGESNTTFCAMTALNICLGECPAGQQGCWPTSGKLTQPPYGEYSHSVVDAMDIGAPVGRTIYAPFNGTAYAFDTNSDEPGNQGLVFRKSDGSVSRIYGKHVLLVTDQGFVLLMAHMSQHGSLLSLGQGVQVSAEDVIGYVGNSGSTAAFPMGMHLHYEYRVPSGGTWKSVIPGAPQDPLSGIVPGIDGGDFVYADNLQTVSYDGGPSGKLPVCTTQR